MDNREIVDAIQRMQDYIEQHIKEPITLHMIAQAAGYSPWHSARIFKEMTGKTLFEYIRALRLSRAAMELRNKDTRIIDVALDFVFDSHEGFTRAFSKQFGMTPHHYSRTKASVNLFMPKQARDYYIRLLKGEDTMSEKQKTNTVFVQVIDRPERKLLLKRASNATNYYEYCEELGCDEVWNVLTGIREAIYEPMGMWMPENMRSPNTSIYCQGVEVPSYYSAEVPEGFDLVDLLPCKMMVFQGQPYDDEDFEKAIGELWEVMKDYNPELYGFSWADEDGPRFQLEPWGYRGYIEARPVRQLNP